MKNQEENYFFQNRGLNGYSDNETVAPKNFEQTEKLTAD